MTITKITAILFASFFLVLSLSAQKILPNTKIGKQEFEFNTSFLGSNFSEFSSSLIYRKPIGDMMKMGGGMKLAWGLLNEPRGKRKYYPSIVLDIARFIAERQKWSINLQPEYYFFKRRNSFTGNDPVKGPYDAESQLKFGFAFSIGGNHRAIISKRLQIITGIFNSYQYVKNEVIRKYQSNPNQPEVFRHNKFSIGAGLKVGLIF